MGDAGCLLVTVVAMKSWNMWRGVGAGSQYGWWWMSRGVAPGGDSLRQYLIVFLNSSSHYIDREADRIKVYTGRRWSLYRFCDRQWPV